MSQIGGRWKIETRDDPRLVGHDTGFGSQSLYLAQQQHPSWFAASKWVYSRQYVTVSEQVAWSWTNRAFAFFRTVMSGTSTRLCAKKCSLGYRFNIPAFRILDPRWARASSNISTGRKRPYLQAKCICGSYHHQSPESARVFKWGVWRHSKFRRVASASGARIHS